MMTLADVSGTARWLTSRIDLRTEHKIRKALRALERAADARLVVVWVLNDRGDVEVIASAGDFDAMPERPPALRSTKPSYVEVEVDLGSRELAVVHQVTVGRKVVKMALAVIAPGIEANEALLDAVEQTAADVEEIVVEGLSRAAS